MTSFAILFAAGINGDVIEFVVVVIIAILAGVGKLLANMKGPPGQGPRPLRPARPTSTDVAGEIDDFLRRAAERRTGQSDQKPQQPILQAQPVRRSPTPRSSQGTQQPILAEAVSEGASKPVGGKVTEHVKKFLDTEEFSRRTSRLGDDVVKTDQQIDQHLHQVFDHTLSRIASTPGETAAAPVAVTPLELAETSPEALVTSDESLFSFFATPESLSQAVVLSEIFHRPEERW